MIAITDHNMVENGPYVEAAAGEAGPTVLLGMELQTIEEVHVLVLFPDYETAMEMQKMVYDLLPPIENDPDYFGDQVVVDAHDEIVRFESKLLLNSSNISINDAATWARNHGSLAIASHIDSSTFGIITQLGYVPEEIPFDALEIRSEKRLDNVLPFIPSQGPSPGQLLRCPLSQGHRKEAHILIMRRADLRGGGRGPSQLWEYGQDV